MYNIVGTGKLVSVRNAATATVLFLGNTVYMPVGYGWSGTTPFSTVGVFTLKNNILYFADGNIVGNNIDFATYNDFYGFASTTAGTGNITSDPLFVDAANSNFNLRPSSPAVDSGVII